MCDTIFSLLHESLRHKENVARINADADRDVRIQAKKEDNRRLMEKERLEFETKQCKIAADKDVRVTSLSNAKATTMLKIAIEEKERENIKKSAATECAKEATARAFQERLKAEAEERKAEAEERKAEAEARKVEAELQLFILKLRASRPASSEIVLGDISEREPVEVYY